MKIMSIPVDPIEFKYRNEEIRRKAEEVSERYNYHLDVTTSQRTLTKLGVNSPPHGTEIFVSKIPRELFEDQLFPYFASVGRIFKHRLMMSPSGISNRGCAYIAYENTTAAKMAILNFHDKEIIDGCKLSVRQSVDNRRIFVGGIPEHKTKKQVWNELLRVGIKQIVDVIMYRSYSDPSKNRGFVFVEFSTHEDAASVRVNFKHAILFENRVQVDWSAPLHTVDDFTMQRVKKLFLRNLPVTQTRGEFAEIVINVIGSSIPLEKVYKYRDYAFLHFCTRRDAQRGLALLRNHFKFSEVEVAWAKPAPPCKKSPAKEKRHPERMENNNNFVENDASSQQQEVGNNYLNQSQRDIEDFPQYPVEDELDFNHMELIRSILGSLKL